MSPAATGPWPGKEGDAKDASTAGCGQGTVSAMDWLRWSLAPRRDWGGGQDGTPREGVSGARMCRLCGSRVGFTLPGMGFSFRDESFAPQLLRRFFCARHVRPRAHARRSTIWQNRAIISPLNRRVPGARLAAWSRWSRRPPSGAVAWAGYPSRGQLPAWWRHRPLP